MECDDKFAPETVCNDKPHGTEWIRNNVKDAFLERNKKLQKWTDNPSDENRSAYKFASITWNQECKKTSKLRKTWGCNLSTRTVFRTLIWHVREGQPKSTSLDLELINEDFTSIGSILTTESTESKTTEHVFWENLCQKTDSSWWSI